MISRSMKILSLLAVAVISLVLLIGGGESSETSEGYYTNYYIDGTTGHSWANMGTNIWLQHGDRLDIYATAGSPINPTKIELTNNACVTITGQNQTVTNLYIVESNDDWDHEVTIKDLKITAPAGKPAYTSYGGRLYVSGAVTFTGNGTKAYYGACPYGISGGTSSKIDSLNGGTLTINGGAYEGMNLAAWLSIEGNVKVNVNSSVQNTASTKYKSGAISFTREALASNQPLDYYLDVSKNASLTVNSARTAHDGILCYPDGYRSNLTITNNGTISAYRSSTASSADGIFNAGGLLTIKNSGTLTSTGIYGGLGNIDITCNTGATITVTNTSTGILTASTGYINITCNGTLTSSVTMGNSQGIHSGGDLTISGSGKVTATATGDDTSGLKCGRVMTLTSKIGGSIKASGGQYGMYSQESIWITGSSSTFEATTRTDTTTYGKYGMYSENGSIEIDIKDGSTLTATSETYGIYTKKLWVSIKCNTSSTVTATTTTVTDPVYGVAIFGGSSVYVVSGSSSTVSASGRIGIQAKSYMDITADGTVTAKGFSRGLLTTDNGVSVLIRGAGNVFSRGYGPQSIGMEIGSLNVNNTTVTVSCGQYYPGSGSGGFEGSGNRGTNAIKCNYMPKGYGPSDKQIVLQNYAKLIVNKEVGQQGGTNGGNVIFGIGTGGMSSFYITPGATLEVYMNTDLWTTHSETHAFTMGGSGGSWVVKKLGDEEFSTGGPSFTNGTSTTSSTAYVKLSTGYNGSPWREMYGNSVELSTPPTISGPTSMTLTEGYSTAYTGEFTTTGGPKPTLSMMNSKAKIVLDGNKLRIDPGLTAGAYDVVLRATNVSGVADLNFRLNVLAKPTVTSVSIAPSSVTMNKGATQQFTATVNGTGSPSQGVTWSVTGKTSASTTISSSGLLTIASNETSTSLTVTAKSTADTTKSGSATVTIRSVTSVDVYPSPATMTTGQTGVFTSIVNGTGNPSQGVTWSVSGNNSSGTSMNQTTGVLIVAGNETAKTLTVKATSTADTTIFGTSTVTLTVPVTVSGVAVSPSNINVEKGKTQQFSATVTGTNNPAQTVTWSVTGGSAGTSISTSGLLTVAAGETATSLTVTAKSTVDTTKSGSATATVVTPTTVTSVTVTPSTVSVEKGATQQFTATVLGTGNPSTAVTWSVAASGSQPVTSTISSTGQLTVAPGEVNTVLIVKATSTSDATKSGTATVNVKAATGVTTVTGVTVSPDRVDVPKGSTYQFTAGVSGTGNPSQDVTWTLTGNGAGTSISPAGLLTIASGETASTLTVKATSKADPTKSGTATVTVTAQITINSVTVSPAKVDVQKGETFPFTATVAGVGRVPQDVTWSVTGGVSGTTISPAGILTVAVNETATTLTVTAKSTINDKVSGTATATVVTVTTVTGVAVSPSNADMQKGTTQQFTAIVTGVGGPSQNVTWSVSGGGSGTSISQAGVLTVAAGETAATLTVTAKSTADTTKAGTATVTIITVTSVTVSPSPVDVEKGATQLFKATVSGAGNPSQNVAWSVTGGVSGTTISQAGILTIAADETAATLTVTAKSAVDGTKSGTATVSVKAATGVTRVTGVSVQPQAAAVAIGSTQQFTAVVTGSGSPAQTVTWSLLGATDAGTTLSAAGLLTIGAGEKATTLTVKALSTADNTKSGVATVTVKEAGSTGDPSSKVSGVSVSPQNAGVAKGASRTFTASVSGTNSPPQTVTWTVSGNNDPNTAISPAGILTIGADETASTVTVKATSTFDATKSGSVNVKVNAAGSGDAEEGGGGGFPVLIVVIIVVVIAAVAGAAFFMFKKKP